MNLPICENVGKNYQYKDVQMTSLMQHEKACRSKIAGGPVPSNQTVNKSVAVPQLNLRVAEMHHIQPSDAVSAINVFASPRLWQEEGEI